MLYHLDVVIGSLDVRRRTWRHLSVIAGSSRCRETLISYAISLQTRVIKTHLSLRQFKSLPSATTTATTTTSTVTVISPEANEFCTNSTYTSLFTVFER